MTLEMGSHFALIALDIQEIFDVIFIKNYNDKIHYLMILLLWLFLHLFRLFFMNYECEKVSTKVSSLKNVSI